MSAIEQHKQGGWEWLTNTAVPRQVSEEFEKQFRLENNGTIGKYLFFSDSKQDLLDLADKLLVKYKLYNAKVPAEDQTEGDFVLCLYDYKNRIASELKQYETSSIRYRYWKSDKKTITGES